MNLKKNIKSIVFTYTDEECVRLKDLEADKFKELMIELVSVYNTSALVNEKVNCIDLDNYFNYELIRPGMSGSNETVRS